MIIRKVALLSLACAVFFSLSVFPSTAVFAQSRDCESREGILLAGDQFSKKVEELTNAQIAQAEEIREILRQRGRAQGWSEERWKSAIAEYLASTPYRALEAQRAPHTQKINDFKAAFRNAKTMSEGRSFCLGAPDVLAAVEESFKINTRQIEFAREFFSNAR